MYTVKFKIWMEKDGKIVIGSGGVEMLRHIIKTKNLKKTAEKMGMSYRDAWGRMRDMERLVGSKVIESRRGGKDGTWTVVTPLGMEILSEYEKRYACVKKIVEKYFKNNPIRLKELREQHL